MKTTIEFDNLTEREELQQALSAGDMVSALNEIGNEVFRPARKHGYVDEKIEALMQKLGSDANELVSLLETKYYEILEDHDVNKFL